MSKHPKQHIQPQSGKYARQLYSPTESKIPRMASDPASISKMTPVWKIGRIDVDGLWGHANIDRDTLWKQMFPKLKNYESMTWGSIAQNQHHNHSVEVSKLDKRARKRLEELGVEVDELFRFRLNGTQRVWGIRDREVFYILWWDPNHEICPSSKKNT